MKKILKRTLSIFLSTVMLLSTTPLSIFVGVDLFSTKAEAVEYAVGDIIEFGSYPQSEVTDSDTLSALNAQIADYDWEADWISYGYYIGYGDWEEFGIMTQSDYMKYTDVTYNGNKYRAVKFTQYRPFMTCGTSDYGYQVFNGYHPDTIYWFKFEPLCWQVIDPSDGLILCKTIIDSQAYSDTFYYYSDTDEYYNDTSHTNYANDYATSSIREWLNDDFYNTAFTSNQKTYIKTATLDNSAFNSDFSVYDSATTYDKVFLLSWNDMLNTKYGFNSSYTNYDTARRAQGSDYAKCQGLFVLTGSNPENSAYYGNSFWRLRTSGYDSSDACDVSFYGETYSFQDFGVPFTGSGIRPAIKISNLSSEHVCDFSDFSHYQADYPHYAVYKCSCGVEKVITTELLGDINSDGKINSIDALMVLNAAVNKLMPTEIQLRLCDVNCDKKINSTDALIILQFSVGNIVKFPITQN